jgi:hypothetical protein
VLPDVRSVLMDKETLLAHKKLWSLEHAQSTETALDRLTSAEQELFSALKANIWGSGVRLEQERLPWAAAMEELLLAVGSRAEKATPRTGAPAREPGVGHVEDLA